MGAVLLRDGVCALPEGEGVSAELRAIAARVNDFGGHATLVQRAQLENETEQALIARSRADRAAEYGEIAREAEDLMDHLRRETQHREFTSRELHGLEQHTNKLRRWTEQIRARDYFSVEEAGRVQDILTRCENVIVSYEPHSFKLSVTQ